MSPPHVSRRTLLRAAVVTSVGAATTAAAVLDLGPFGPGVPAATVRTVQPVPAGRVAAGTAVAAHPSFGGGVYADPDPWMSRMATMGITTFRGLYDPANAGCREAVAACRRHGLRWIMLVVPESDDAPTDQDPEVTRAVVAEVGRTAADVCAAIEGLNEPNHHRGGAPVADGWATQAAAHQQAIWEVVRGTPSLAGVEVIGPSLHDVSARASVGDPGASGGADHLEQLAAAGVGAWQDRLGLHSYPNGGMPLHGLAARVDLARAAFGDDVALHVTETGYTNALFQPTNDAGTYVASEESLGPRPTSEDAAAVYLRRAALQLAALDLPWVCYELLDDPDPAPKDVAEAAFGLWRVGSADAVTWSLKPGGLGLTRLLEAVGPAGEDDDPDPVRLELDVAEDAAVEVVLTSGRGGALVAHLFRDVAVWDPALRRGLPVAAVPVRLRTEHGSWQVDVAADVISVPLR